MTPAEFPSFTKNSMTALRRNDIIGDSHFLAVHDRNVIGAHALILGSFWRGKMPPMAL